MKLGEAVGLSEGNERRLVRLLQFALLLLLGYGVVTVQVGVAAYGGFALAVTLLPAAVRREYGYTMDAGLVLWITIAVTLHIIGSLGAYQRYQWYDEIAHTVSATVIAGFGYAALRAFEDHTEAIDVPGTFEKLFIVVFVLATGVLWEIIEFASGGMADLLGMRGPLVVYGIDDIVTDMIFNGVGGLVVAFLATSPFTSLAGFFGGRLAAADSDD